MRRYLRRSRMQRLLHGAQPWSFTESQVCRCEEGRVTIPDDLSKHWYEDTEWIHEDKPLCLVTESRRFHLPSTRLQDLHKARSKTPRHKTSSNIQHTLGPNYRPQRLVVGAKSSKDVFNEAMFRIFRTYHLPESERRHTPRRKRWRRAQNHIEGSAPESESPWEYISAEI